MQLNTDEFLGEFLDEVNMYLNDLDTAILNLENDPENIEHLNDIFRIAHSIKGVGAMMGFDKLENLTHNMEDVLYDIRDGKAVITKEIIDLLLVCHDFLHKILLEIKDTGTEKNIKMTEIKAIISKLHSLLGNTEKKTTEELKLFKGLKISKEKAKEIRDDLTDEEICLYYIRVNIAKDCEMKKVRAFMILNDLKNCGKILKSHPSISELKNDKYNMTEPKIHILLDNKIEKEKMKQELSNMSNIE
ncbi:MAG: Hpt domain-containing protein, partial [Fusobacteriota bacterium]